LTIGLESDTRSLRAHKDSENGLKPGPRTFTAGAYPTEVIKHVHCGIIYNIEENMEITEMSTTGEVVK
jgi:hypothetical protein